MSTFIFIADASFSDLDRILDNLFELFSRHTSITEQDLAERFKMSCNKMNPYLKSLQISNCIEKICESPRTWAMLSSITDDSLETGTSFIVVHPCTRHSFYDRFSHGILCVRWIDCVMYVTSIFHLLDA